MKKILFIFLFTFFSFNIFAQEIKFSMYNDMHEVCPKVDFYGFTIKNSADQFRLQEKQQFKIQL